MKTSAKRKSELALLAFEEKLEHAVDVVERLPKANLSESLTLRIRATSSIEALPISTIPIDSNLDALLAWIGRILETYFAGSTIWIGTGIEDFPFVRVRPTASAWLRCFVNQRGELDKVMISEDLTFVGRLSTEETSHEFLASS